MENKSLPIFKILYKSWLAIVLTAVLFALVGFWYSASQIPPTYTVSRSLMLRTEIHDDEYVSQSASQANLAKIYFTTVEKIIKSPKMVNEVKQNNLEKGITVSSGAIGISYSDNSLIFRVSYTDLSKEKATEKLNALIETFSQSSTIKQAVMADSVQFIPTQSIEKLDVVENTSHTNYILIGGAVGLALSVVIAVIVYLADTTVRDRQEFEELTGVNVIAYINKDVPKKKKIFS